MSVSWQQEKNEVLLVTAWAMPAAAVLVFYIRFGMATAGVSKFFRGRAGFPVTGAARPVQVCLTAGAGMEE